MRYKGADMAQWIRIKKQKPAGNKHGNQSVSRNESPWKHLYFVKIIAMLNYIISFSFLIIKVKKDKTKILNTWDLSQLIFRWPIACLSFFLFYNDYGPAAQSCSFLTWPLSQFIFEIQAMWSCCCYCQKNRFQ